LIFFNLILEKIMTDALDDFDGRVSIGGRKIYNLRFADDIDLIAGSMVELSELTTRLDTGASTVDMVWKSAQRRVRSYPWE